MVSEETRAYMSRRVFSMQTLLLVGAACAIAGYVLGFFTTVTITWG